MKFDFKFNIRFVVITLIVALVVVPILFNVLFLWESGWSRGETSDWFTLYGNIFGGLIGGFFTYLALLLTFNDQKENKKKEMSPRIDIPHQTIEFIDSDDKFNFKPIMIELNNIGGSIAKNIECTLTLPNFDQVLSALEESKENLKIDLIRSTSGLIPNVSRKGELDQNIDFRTKKTHLIVRDDEGTQKASLGGVYKAYDAEFIGTCIPLLLNYEAKTQYILKHNVSQWINYIVKNRNYTYGSYNEDELFNFNLEVKYSSDEYGDFSDTFNLEWGFIGIWAEDSQLTYKYVLKSTKVNTQGKVNQ
ncbi:hypothetical protein FQP34_22375 [Peribacillus simplex]|uniref:Uncharacterized protein n=1 Tax=Peribacillus simplex TaxID=1478 RepID=A0A8B5XQN4_9BACI|nr:hypothetical protein [Peribacillus simplex]TVX77172.1 hypothetical protein FQP34_22375 [Peribacillus simplex]